MAAIADGRDVPSAPISRADNQTAVIIGGSVAGLFHGITLKKLGYNVRILEQNLTSTRSDQAAGLGVGLDGFKFFTNHDSSKRPFNTMSNCLRFFNRDIDKLHVAPFPMRLTSWNVIYYRLRAMYDGLVSDYEPQEIPVVAESESSGNGTYELGKKVTGISYQDGVVSLEYQDLLNGGAGTVHADLVIAADGASSSTRRILLPNVEEKYAGYVAFRGTVRESNVTNESRKFFESQINYQIGGRGRGLFVSYMIPGENGSLEPGSRFFNYAWFYHLPKSSSDYVSVMTDSDGHVHRHTIPVGKMDPKAWAKQRQVADQVLLPPFRELVHKTEQPFVAAIRDCAAEQAAFYDGKLLLVGDAFALFRPHGGASTNQSALHSQLLEQLLTGQISLAEWEYQVKEYASWMQAVSTTMGAFGLYSWPGFALEVLKLCVVFRARTWGRWYLDPITTRLKVLKIAAVATWSYLWI